MKLDTEFVTLMKHLFADTYKYCQYKFPNSFFGAVSKQGPEAFLDKGNKAEEQAFDTTTTIELNVNSVTVLVKLR